MHGQWTVGFAASIALWVAACSGSTSSGGSRGDSDNGNAGSSGAGNGSGGTGGSFRPGDTPPITGLDCTVQFRPLSAPALTNLPAGPDRTVTIQGESAGLDAVEAWSWFASHAGIAVPVVQDPNDPSIITMPLNDEGRYELSVEVGVCTGKITISAVFANKRTAYYWLRIIPPEGSPFLPHEGGVGIRADAVEQTTFELPSGFAVPIDPRAPNALDLASAVPSYLRLSASGSSFLQEGRSTAKGVATFRVHPLRLYSLMIIPDNGWAPRLYDNLMLSGSTTPAFTQNNNPDFALSQGTEIRARLRDGGFAVTGARLLFRAGALPSTLGTSDDNGNARVYVAGDGNRSFGVQVIAPAGKGLPDLATDETNGLRLPAPRNIAETAVVEWSDLPRGKLEIAIVSDKTGLPIRDAHVIAQFATPLKEAGTAALDGNASVSLSGKIKITANSDASGNVVLDSIPRSRYELTITPPLGSDSPITTAVDLSTVDPGPTEIRVPERVRFAGRFTGTIVPGTVIEALPDDPADNRAVSVPLDTDGGYILLLDREKNYRLRLRMAAASRLNLPLGALSSGKIGGQLPDRPVPRTLPLQGLANNRSVGIPGALVEVYCLADLPDCIDFRKPDVNGALRIAEGRTDSKGMFQIPLPDPSDE